MVKEGLTEEMLHPKSIKLPLLGVGPGLLFFFGGK